MRRRPPRHDWDYWAGLFSNFQGLPNRADHYAWANRHDPILGGAARAYLAERFREVGTRMRYGFVSGIGLDEEYLYWTRRLATLCDEQTIELEYLMRRHSAQLAVPGCEVIGLPCGNR